jgi:hypothetical protein
MDVTCRSHTTTTATAAALRSFVNATRRPRKQTLPNLIIVEDAIPYIMIYVVVGAAAKRHVSHHLSKVFDLPIFFICGC